MIWRPAPSAGLAPGVVDEPVGHVDIAPTILAAAGLETPQWMQGTVLPKRAGEQARERVMTEWIDSFDGNDITMQSMVRDGYIVTAYEPTNRYQGTEGELYCIKDDPHQWHNLWDDAGHRKLREELVADMKEHLPAGREQPREKIAPV